MKKLDLNQMEIIDGSNAQEDCQFNLGLGLGLLAIGIVSGGAGFVLAGALWAYGASESSSCDGVTSLW